MRPADRWWGKDERENLRAQRATSLALARDPSARDPEAIGRGTGAAERCRDLIPSQDPRPRIFLYDNRSCCDDGGKTSSAAEDLNAGAGVVGAAFEIA